MIPTDTLITTIVADHAALRDADPQAVKRMTFGALLKAHRTAAGLSQFKLAIRAGVSQRLISEYETFRFTPQRRNVLILANALELSFDDRMAMLTAAGHDDDATIERLTKERDDAVRKADRLRVQLREERETNADLVRERDTLEGLVDQLRSENRPESPTIALSGNSDAMSSTADSEPEPVDTIYGLEYLELIRAHKLVKTFYAAPDGEYAAVANRVLHLIGEICEKADPWKAKPTQRTSAQAPFGSEAMTA